MARQRGIVRANAMRSLFAARVLPVFLAVCGLLAFLALAQNRTLPDAPSAPVKERYLVDRFPGKPSIPPSVSIPLDPLGFSAPGALYLGARHALASLDFLDESRLLFTFRVPGLLHRDLKNSGTSDERQIRAVVLSLPMGTVENQATWTLHDRQHYLWPLKNGHFLLRDRNLLSEGDAALHLKPYLDFPGSLFWLEMDPGQQFLVTNSREPLVNSAKTGATADQASPPASKPGEAASPSTASAAITVDRDSVGAETDPGPCGAHSPPRIGRGHVAQPRP